VKTESSQQMNQITEKNEENKVDLNVNVSETEKEKSPEKLKNINSVLGKRQSIDKKNNENENLVDLP